MSKEEQQAIARLREGDIGGLEFLVRRHQVQATRAAYLVTRDRRLAEDVVQAAFLRVFERINQFDGSRPFQPWFFRVVLNDAIKAASRARRHSSLDHRKDSDGLTLADLLPDHNPGPEEMAEQAELRDAVGEALDKLSPAQRATVTARYFLGLSEAEIAQQTGRAPGTVKWLLHVARGRLRTLLGNAW